ESRHAVLSRGRDGCRSFHPRQGHQAGEDGPARQSGRHRRQSAAPGRRTRDDRSHLGRTPGLRMGARRRPGPFRYEGKHFNFRNVNPWVLPLQRPHPPFWIPGLVSPDTAFWCARKRYPYVALATRLQPTIELWDFYAKAAAQEGYQAGPENFGYLQPVVVADTQERAEELCKRILFGGAFAHFARPEWMFPPGYNSKAATKRLAQLETGANTSGKPLFTGSGEESEEQIEAVKRSIYAGYPQVLRDMQMIAGTP